MGLLDIPVRTDWVVRAILYWIHPLWSLSFPIIDQMRNPAQASTQSKPHRPIFLKQGWSHYGFWIGNLTEGRSRRSEPGRDKRKWKCRLERQGLASFSYDRALRVSEWATCASIFFLLAACYSFDRYSGGLLWDGKPNLLINRLWIHILYGSSMPNEVLLRPP